MSSYTNMPCEEMNIAIQIAQYLPALSWNIPKAQHLTWFLFWNPVPGARLVYQDKVIEAVPETAFLLPPCTVISAFSDRPFAHLYAHFTVGAPFDRVLCRPYCLPAGAAKAFFAARKHEAPEWRRQLHWRILIAEYLLELPAEAFALPEKQAMDPRIMQALKFCQKHAMQATDNAALAKRAGMSLTNFYRLFQQELGMSPWRYRNNLRLNYARDLLLRSNAPRIEEIARQCGYADRYQFSKAFKLCFGLTPVEFLQASKSE